MTGWIVVGVVVLVFLVLLYGPVDLCVTLERPFLPSFRLSYFGIPLPVGGQKRRPAMAPLAAPKKKKKRKGGGLIRLIGTLAKLRDLRPLLAIARVEGAPRYLWDNGRRALGNMRLAKGRLVLNLWLASPSANAWLMAFLAWAQPRIGSGRSRIEIEFAPDPLRVGFGAEGEMVLRTRPAFWLGLGLRLLFDRTTWRILAAYREAKRG
jgi:hypothetical protein